MPLNTAAVRTYLQAFDFPTLFREELGWDNPKAPTHRFEIDGHTYTLTPVAEKRGFQVFVCSPDAEGKVPASGVRAKIERQLTPLAYLHLLIFADAAKTAQTWQWARREAGQPLAIRQQTTAKGKETLLIQKLEALVFSIDDEENTDSTVVGLRAQKAFDVEKVTKKFYDRFKTEHTAFLRQIEGIEQPNDREWYASVMLNRLMFVYFIQKKGFLDNDPDYLQNRLRLVRQRHGAGQFQSFYRLFLLRLFHEGLGRQERPSDLAQLIGTVPYLNGGLFDVHQLEHSNPDIDIPDEAFGRVFDFFEDYDWHLDERPLRRDNEINPDVLGYIFEKYINQKQMGAYYTKEDITEYIGKNTIIPWLFDTANGQNKVAFEPNGALWGLLRDDPDRYIYAAVRHGADEPLPAPIEAGITNVAQRGDWNRPAPAPFALPTETWREHIARRQRCHEVRAKLRAGEVHSINDLITYNLDIRQFAQDAIQTSEGPDLVRAFYDAIRTITVLDPTCGSGAFLFAALNILEPLYEACLERMQGFVDDADTLNHPGSAGRYKDFRATLAEMATHPNRRSFILKSIILNNLYGVDIMEEAVEICKLRLFLKLAAQVEPDPKKDNQGIDPLPDIDFNIRAGNTLVGFATYADVEKALTAKMDFDNAMPRIQEDAEIVARAFTRFREMQTKHGMKAEEFLEAKHTLRQRLHDQAERLNRYLAWEYGVYADKKEEYEQWKASHQPFHWFVEFHDIMSSGGGSSGFDVIVGNPPYISSAQVRRVYILREYETAKCSDVYANVLERATTIIANKGRSGMIVPLSLTFSRDFDTLRKLLYKKYALNWFSSFARIPAALFSADVRVRNTIHLGYKGSASVQPQTMTTVLHRWFGEARPHLFTNLSYAPFSALPYKQLIPKINTPALACAFEECFSHTRKTIASSLALNPTKHKLFFKESAYNWLNFCLEQPPCYNANGKLIPHTMFGEVSFTDQQYRNLAFLFLNGKIMFAFWCMIGDDFHVTQWMFADFPIDLASIPDSLRSKLLPLTSELNDLMEQNVSFKLNAGKKVGNYNLAKCRSVTDRSDALFAEYLGLDTVWSDIELMYAQIVKTNFSQSDEDGDD